MSRNGIIAADATKNPFKDKFPNAISNVAVAIAVEDRDEFNAAYFEIVSEKIEEYGLKVAHPIIKDKHINRYVPLWEQSNARRDIVSELLQIDALDTIYITETYLQPQWIEMYSEQSGKYRRIKSSNFVEDVLFQYYDIVPIWKYLKRYKGGKATHYNVMTDDFSGEICEAYQEIGEICESFEVIPYGDRTYPILSLADLTTGLLKQEVYPLRRKEIREYIEDKTVAYTVTESIYRDDDDDNKDFQKIVPHKTENYRTDILRPDPTIHVDRGDIPKKKLMTLDIFECACLYAQQNEGCVKLFDETNDRHHFSGDDIILCLGETPTGYVDYGRLNSKYSAEVMGWEKGMEYLTDGIDSSLIL